MANILATQDVSKRYGNFQAVNRISISVAEGSIYGILGPNGAGKTSLLRMLTQIIAPDSGRIYFHNNPLQKKDVAEFGYMPEERGLYRKMQVRAHIEYFAKLRGLSCHAAKEATTNWLQRLNIEGWATKKVEELSKGMQQKIQFINTVVHRPQLLILDEPFSGFDPVNADVIRDELLNLNKDATTILLSSHRMENVEELCSAFCLINKGQLVLEGEKEAVKQANKKNLLELHLDTDLPEDELAEVLQVEHNFEVVEAKSMSERIISFKIHAPVEASNQLLSIVSNYGAILLFREQLPTIEEIFISKVQD